MSLQGLETEKSSLIPNDKSPVTTSVKPHRTLGNVALVALLSTFAITGFLVLFRWAPDTQSTTGFNSDSSVPRFRVSFPASVHSEPITGRLMVCIARKHAVSDPQGEDQPRFLVDDSKDTQQIFAVDVWDFAPADTEAEHREVNATHAVGYPMLFMDQIPAGEYWVQAVLHPYVEYNRSDGRNLQLPSFSTFESDGGVLTAPGTLYSATKLALFDPATFSVDLVLTQVEPDLPPLGEPHELLKHVTFRSPSLSQFWGTDVFLKAWVLLPYRFFDDEMKDVHYPLFVYHTHYSREFEHSFYPTPPANTTTASLGEQYGFYFFSNWTSDKPTDPFTNKRGIVVQLQHANPYYDDSYAVNSANIGPYGDAFTYEFLPFLEKRFRGVGEGWARTMYGGSTGGWESFATQVYYPEEYNGCWSFCPDAFDFHRFQQVDLFANKNAYYARGDWTQKDRGAKRNYLGDIRETMAEENHHELAMGSRGRSGGQWDAWQAVYSPVNNTDGYPAAVWDKLTGEIHPQVVEYWETHYDVRAKLQREWHARGLGHKLVNKLHVYVGVTDSYYLNDAVFLLEDFLKTTTEPYYNGSIVYGVTDGRGYEHCWTGSFDQSISLGWQTVNQRMIPQMVDHIVQSAPEGADLSFTSY
ncbi:hypothetical protein PI124_g15419 [Phytophthora idaei]|nr:hypothetical protein PI125_g15400 [Phytophthora idaei]KAG3143750.1 hypothetical protein PI126_g14471 [Phytophthora idaei]KAG3239655.1 hypothetical protein PI124_g15419 [Phytophthora idaei]